MADLTERNAGPGRLRELLEGPEPVLAPGAYDALSARLVEAAGSTDLIGLPEIENLEERFEEGEVRGRR